MIVGYARTSTLDQVAGLEDQIKTLTEVGCEKIYQEQVSSISDRTQLNRALDFVREGDTLVVKKLDRLARSVPNLMDIIATLENKGVGLKILDLGMDTGTPTGKLMLTVLGAVAQFEREVMLERQRAGIQRARSEGKFKGRTGYSKDKRKAVVNLAEAGLTKEHISEQLGISQATIYRILAADKRANNTSLNIS